MITIEYISFTADAIDPIDTGLGKTVTRGGKEVLAMPDGCYTSATFTQTANTQVSQSPFSRHSQTNELAGSLWGASFTLNMYFDNDREDKVLLGKIRSWLLKLRGASGRFLAHDVTWAGGLGSFAGSGQALQSSEPSSAGDTTIRVLPASGISPLLAEGDFIQIEDHLAMVTKDFNNGQTILDFEPPLVHPVTSGTTLDCTNPSVIMRLVDDSQVNFAKSSFHYNEPVTFEAVQAL